jgi:HlyD family secretion protein
MAKRSTGKKVIIILSALVLIGVFFFVAKKAGWIGKPKAEEVEVAEVKKQLIIEKVSASGKVQPEVEVKISPDVSGEIIELNVAEGDSVAAGKLLVTIRPDNYESMVDRARATLNTNKANLLQARAATSQSEARLNRAQQDYERNKSLFDQKVISDQDFEISRTNYEVARQELESAKQNVQAAVYNIQSAEANLKDAAENLRKTKIYAPVSGIVSKLNVEKGERVVGTTQMAGTEIMRIANLNNMEVRVDVNENDIVRVQIGDTAEIEVDSYSNVNKKFRGKVTSIANTAKETQSADAITEFEVKVRIINESYEDLRTTGRRSPFRPGMTASVDIITNQKPNTLSVPLSAVTTRSQQEEGRRGGEEEGATAQPVSTRPAQDSAPQEVVFILENGVAKKVNVKTGISDFDNIEIISGVEPGQKVISGPFSTVSKKLKDGDEVTIKPAATAENTNRRRK